MTDEHEPRPPLTRSERIFMRLSMWQTVLSLAGVFTGVVALYAALNESAAVRRQSAAAVWPFVQVMVDDFEGPEGASFALSMSNVGVGPARVRTLKITIDDQPMDDWREVAQAMTEGSGAVFAANFARNRVFSPGEQVALMSTSDPALASALREAVATSSGAIEYCYCSIFDDCWLADSREPDADHSPVRACPDFGEDAFRN